MWNTTRKYIFTEYFYRITLTLTFQGHSRSNLMVPFWLPIYGFLLMASSNIAPNSASLWDKRVWNPNDIDFDLSRSLHSDGAIWLLLYDFLLVSNNNYISISHRLAVTADQKKIWNSSTSYRWAKISDPHTHPYPGANFSKSNHFISGSERRLPPKMKLIG